MGSRSAILVAAASAVSVAGCILLVNESTPNGDQFKSSCVLLFDGGADGGACGACLASSCGAALTTCCGDPDCRTFLPALDTCAAGGTCDPTTLPAGVASCITSSCAGVCNVPAGVDCTVNTKGAQACGCGWDKTPNSTPCTASAFTNGICCEDNGWPSATATRGCGCFSYGCALTTPPDCDCTVGANFPGTVGNCSITASGIQQCCTSTTALECYCTSTSTTCPPGYKTTTSCNLDLFCYNFNTSPATSCR